MNFISSSRSNPCPICNDMKGKCRSKDTSFTLPNHSTIISQQFFCMAVRENHNGFKFTGETSDRLWGKFISYEFSQTLSNAWGRQRKRHYRPSKKVIIKRPPTSKPKYSHLLKIEERHKAIASVLCQLSLSPHHRKALIKRGFTNQQIKQYGLKSVRYKQPLNISVSDRLAGVSKSGKHLTNKFSGLIVPIRNAEGLYLGWQYRLDNASDCRYLWASSDGASSHLAEYSELPLSFHFPDGGITNHSHIALTEGIGFKPQLTANRFGLISLGASGGMFAVSPKLLKTYLKQASSILQNKSVLLFPDAGAVRNPQILKQYKRTIDLIRGFGYNVGIAWWGQIDKSCPDPDEFEGNYQIISTQQFFNLGLKYSAFFPDRDRRNAVRTFLDLLKNTDNPHHLKNAIELFKSRYRHQFDTIKRICWKHLSTERKQLIYSIYS